MNTRILELLKEIKAIVQGKSASDKWMDINAVSDYSSMSKSSVRRSCADGRLKHSKSQGKLLFKKSDVENWLNG